MKFCSNCGKKLSESSKFCPNCGRSIEKVQEVVTKEPIVKEKGKKRNVAIIVIICLLAFLLVVGCCVGGFTYFNGKLSSKDKKYTVSELIKYLDIRASIDESGDSLLDITIKPDYDYYVCDNLKIKIIVNHRKYKGDKEVLNENYFSKVINVNEDCTFSSKIKAKKIPESTKDEYYAIVYEHVSGEIKESKEKLAKVNEKIENQIYEYVSDAIIHNYENDSNLKINRIKYEKFGGNSSGDGKYTGDDVQEVLVEVTGKRNGNEVATHCEYIVYPAGGSSWSINFYENCRYTPTANNNYNNDYVFDNFHNKNWGTLLDDSTVSKMNEKLKNETFDESRSTIFLSAEERLKNYLTKQGYTESNNTFSRGSYSSELNYYEEFDLNNKKYSIYSENYNGKLLNIYEYGTDKLTYTYKYGSDWMNIVWDLNTNRYNCNASLGNWCSQAAQKIVDEDMMDTKEEFVKKINAASVSLDEMK